MISKLIWQGVLWLNIPVLHITSNNIPMIVYVNGVCIGDTTENLLVPVVPDGKVYISCFPIATSLYQPALPVTICLVLKEGLIDAPIGGGTAYLTGEGMLNLEVDPYILPAKAITKPPHAISRVSYLYQHETHIATLYYDNGIKFAIEIMKEDRLVYLYAPEDLDNGVLSNVVCFSNADIVLNGEGNKGHRFLVFSPSASGYKAVIDEYAKGTVENNKAICIRKLDDTRGHQERYEFYYDGEKMKRTESQYGYFTDQPREIKSDGQMARAFVDAVMLGLYEEASGFITGELSEDLSFDDLKEFFGNFNRVFSVTEEPDVKLNLAYFIHENCYLLKGFRFDFTDGLISNIHSD